LHIASHFLSISKGYPKTCKSPLWEIVAQDIRHGDEVVSVQGDGSLDIGEG